MVISGRSGGGGGYVVPLAGIYKGIFEHVLAYACFYKSETFVRTCTFTMKSSESFI